MSKRSKYIVLGLCALTVLGLVDGLVRMLVNWGGIGFAVSVWACYGVVFAWLLVEPMVSALVLSPMSDESVESVEMSLIASEIAMTMGINAPRVKVYAGDHFSAMTAGYGAGATIFLSRRVAGFDRDIVRAVVAHECGHIKLRHMEWRTLMLGSLLLLALIPSGLSLLVVFANLFVLWAVRAMEFKADAAAAKAVGVENMCKALIQVREIVGEVPAWSLMFNSHPMFGQRLVGLGGTKVEFL